MNTPKLFISYAHSSPEHKQSVVDLAAVLRSRGLIVIMDTDVKTPQGPEEGWPKWMKRQLKEADWVLTFFDRTYRRRFDGEEMPGKGLGATWEGAIITARYYRESTINKKFIPLLADGSTVDVIPDEFFGYNHYYIPAQSIELANALRKTPETPQGTQKIKAPASTRDVIELKRCFELLEEALPGKIRDKTPIDPTCTGFSLDMSAFPLRGTDDPVACLAIQTRNDEMRKHALEFRYSVRAHFGFVFELAPEIKFTNVGLEDFFCVVSTADLLRVVNSAVPLDELARLAVRRLPIFILMPYTVGAPAEGAMFFGRRRELQSLSDHPDTHYAVVGPSGIGKSSLLLRHVRLNRAHRGRQTLYMNLHACPRDADGLARHIAMDIEASPRANRLRAAEFEKFVAHRKNTEGGPTELLLDEVDEICGTDAFENLTNVAKMGLIRIVLCGGAGLLTYILHAKSSFSLRLDLLRPGALQFDEAGKLLTAPMSALGFDYESPELIEHICEMTGRLPLLLQRYAASLAEKAIEQSSPTITAKMVSAVDSDFAIISMLMRPISELDDIGARALALALLRHEKSSFTLDEIAHIVRSAPIDLGSRNVFDLCNILCLQGVLIMEESSFRIANGAMKKLARESGYLDL